MEMNPLRLLGDCFQGEDSHKEAIHTWHSAYALPSSPPWPPLYRSPLNSARWQTEAAYTWGLKESIADLERNQEAVWVRARIRVWGQGVGARFRVSVRVGVRAVLSLLPPYPLPFELSFFYPPIPCPPPILTPPLQACDALPGPRGALIREMRAVSLRGPAPLCFTLTGDP